MSSDVPKGWSSVALGDVIRLEYGRALSSSVREAGNVPVYGSNGICGEHSAALVNERGIVVGRKGTAGSVTVTTGPFWPIDTTYFVVPRVEADFDWLAATLEHARLSELNEATGVPGLNRDKAYVQTVLLPPLNEQRRIAEVLRSIDEQTDLTKRALVATNAAKNAALITALHTNSWPTVQVGDLLADTRTPMRSGPFGSALLKSELTESGVPLLGIDNVHAERFVPKYRRFVSEAKYQELARYTVFPGDVMVTIMGTVGRCCVVPEGIGRAISSKHVWTLTLDTSQYSPTLLAWQINHEPRVLEQLRGSAQGGIMSAISSETLRDLRVSQPPRAQMLELEHLITSANLATSLLETELAGLTRLKQFVSCDLLSGRVRLPASAPEVPSARVVQPAFKRAVFAAEVVHQLHNDDRFGSVKHEKIVHLCELHLRLQDDLDRHAYKEAAGPYDPSARRSVERIFRQQKWFDPTKQDKRIVYQPLDASGGHARYFDRYFGDRKAEVQNIIDLLRPLTTQQCEIIATLYAVWNDFLIDGRQPDDDEIVDGVLNNWTDSKRQIPEDKWRAALPWMRQKGLIPTGNGEKTRVAST